MQQLISNILSGMSYGSVYALLAVGLVLAYKTSGIFNLAYGAQAFVAGAVYFDLRVRHQLAHSDRVHRRGASSSRRCSGLLLERLLFRYLRTAPPVARLVTVIGSARRDPADPEAVVRAERGRTGRRASSRTATMRTTRSARSS